MRKSWNETCAFFAVSLSRVVITINVRATGLENLENNLERCECLRPKIVTSFFFFLRSLFYKSLRENEKMEMKPWTRARGDIHVHCLAVKIAMRSMNTLCWAFSFVISRSSNKMNADERQREFILTELEHGTHTFNFPLIFTFSIRFIFWLIYTECLLDCNFRLYLTINLLQNNDITLITNVRTDSENFLLYLYLILRLPNTFE